MIRNLADLDGASVTATDGELGKVSNFLFDDELWMVRYFVVDVGGWLARRDVIVSADAIEQPDWEKKRISAHLSKEQVRDSPDVDSKKPVSRQQEIALREYFNWPAYWGGNLEFPGGSIPAGREYPVHTEEDSHLRSAHDVNGYEVWANNGEIGRLENFIVDEASWHIGYCEVKMGDWLHSRAMLVPTRWVESISWADHRVILNHTLAAAQ